MNYDETTFEPIKCKRKSFQKQKKKKKQKRVKAPWKR